MDYGAREGSITLSLRTRLLGTVIGSVLLLFVLMMIAVRATVAHDLHDLAVRQVTAGEQAFTASLTTRIDQTRSTVASAAAQQNLAKAVESHDVAAVRTIVQSLQQPNGFSFVTVVDAEGRTIVRGNGLDTGSESNPVVREALRDRVASGVTKMDERELQGELLANDVAPFTTALAIAAAAPISYDNRVIGAIYGGSLLSGENTLVRAVSTFTGGQAAVLLGDRIASSSIETADGAPLVNVAASTLASSYFVRIDPLSDTTGRHVGSLWFGVPLAQLDAISNHATRSMVIWGIVGVIVAIAIGVFLAERISSKIAQRSHQVTQSAKELGVLVIGTEVSGDHVVQTRRKLEDMEQLLAHIVPLELYGTEEARRLHALTSDAHGDVIVIDTLASELNDRMQKAVRSVAQLNEVADGLNALVDGIRAEKR